MIRKGISVAVASGCYECAHFQFQRVLHFILFTEHAVWGGENEEEKGRSEKWWSLSVG